MTQAFISIGNSKGIIIPKALFEEAGISSKAQFWIESDNENKSFVIHTKAKNAKKVTASPRIFAILEKVNKEYGPALKKCAQL